MGEDVAWGLKARRRKGEVSDSVEVPSSLKFVGTLERVEGRTGTWRRCEIEVTEG
jgi:hypothetical protein